MSYSLYDYGRMIRDDVRVDAYCGAIDAVLQPGMTVLDLGTGAGFFALYAASRGARHVYAVETNDAIVLARALAADNGLADRVTFIQGSSLEIELPERVDLIISDLRGRLPLYCSHREILADARARFLAEGGTVLPERDELHVALVSVPEWYGRIVSAWRPQVRGLDLSRGRELVTHGLYSDPGDPVAPSALVSEPVHLATIDYGAEAGPFVAKASMTVARPGEVHGILAWFDAVVGEGHGFSNAPGSTAIYGRTLFPWPEARTVVPGDEVDVTISAVPSADDHVWGWTSTLRLAGAASGPEEAFRQCTLLGMATLPHAVAHGR